MRESATQSNHNRPVASAQGRSKKFALGLLAAMLVAGIALSGLRFYSGDARAAVDVQTPIAGNQISGQARIVDGDTIDVNGVRIRLEGIDAPERAQKCPRRWFGNWSCGKAATRKLRALTSRHAVNCKRVEADKYGRVIAACSVAGRDIGAELVRTGLAWAFVKYSKNYVEIERKARSARVGIWSGRRPAQPAWDYRKRHWVTAEQRAPRGCAIKGNISSKGKIYHMPWSAWYAKTRITPSRGERWFCSENEAQTAGWRPVGIY